MGGKKEFIEVDVPSDLVDRVVEKIVSDFISGSL